MGSPAFPAQVLQDLNQGVRWVGGLSEVSGEESISGLTQIVGSI